jgi:hypothetical protein
MMVVPIALAALLQVVPSSSAGRGAEIGLTFSALREDSTRLGAGVSISAPLGVGLRWVLDSSWHAVRDESVREERLFVGGGLERRLFGGRSLALSIHAIAAMARASERIQVLDVDLVHHQTGLAVLVGGSVDVGLSRQWAVRLASIDGVMTRRAGEQTFGTRASAGLVLRRGGARP